MIPMSQVYFSFSVHVDFLRLSSRCACPLAEESGSAEALGRGSCSPLRGAKVHLGDPSLSSKVVGFLQKWMGRFGSGDCGGFASIRSPAT